MMNVLSFTGTRFAIISHDLTAREASEIYNRFRWYVKRSFTVDGEKIIYVLKDGEKVPVKVEVGLKTGSQSEIKSGINEGDELIIR